MYQVTKYWDLSSISTQGCIFFSVFIKTLAERKSFVWALMQHCVCDHKQTLFSGYDTTIRIRFWFTGWMTVV